jgi:predicted TIM-barrel fold metal-dependent hydrolase
LSGIEPEMKITDVHAHLYHPDWYPVPFQRQLAIGYLERRRKSVSPESVDRELVGLNRLLSDKEGDVCLQIMDKVGIEKRALLVIDWGLELGEPACTIREINEAVLGVCRRHPDRLTGFASVDPRRKDATALLAWAFDTLGAAGLKLHPTSHEWTLEDERVFALIEVAAEHSAPVMVHSGRTVNPLCSHHCQPDALLRLAARFPAVNLIAAHSGFSEWPAFGAEAPSNLFFDISAWQERIAESGDGVKDEIKQLVARYPGRVFFGTDAPFCGYNLAFSETKWVATVRECALSVGADAERSVLSGSVLLPY